jgi:tetratricopeptide (TPR) repeat protein
MVAEMPMRVKTLIIAVVVLISPRLHATGADTSTVPPVDPAACWTAIAANDDDRVLAECGPLIENEKTAKADRIKALVARAAAFARRDQLDRAISDYGEALRLEPQADIYNSRGELWWKRGDRPKALADFAAAIKLNPDHPTAKGNYKRLAQELERLGALMAVAGKPSFNCAAAKRPVEKAICRRQPARRPRPSAGAGRFPGPAQCRFRQARIRPAEGDERSAAAPARGREVLALHFQGLCSPLCFRSHYTEFPGGAAV